MEPITQPLTVDDLIMRFRRPILVDGNGCWNWMGSITTQGYAAFNHKLIHGISFRLAGFSCAQDKVICHRCNNKRCVNPNHLYEGTYSENLIDAIKDGKGLGPEVYRQMVKLYASGMIQADIARKLGVSRSLVSVFFKGKLLVHKPENFKEENA